MKTPLINSIIIFWTLILCLFTSIATLSAFSGGEIDAVPDYYEIIEGDSIIFNVLGNDIGEELKVISYSSQTGNSLSEGEGEGEFTFYSEIAGTGQEQFAFFEYVIQDKDGETDETYVAISIKSLYPDFIVQIDRDCTNAEANGTYTLTTLMMGGKPPYYYITNWTDGEIVQQPDIRTIDIVDGFPYRVLVIDSLFNDIIEYGGEVPCLKLGSYCSSKWNEEGNYAQCRYPINENKEAFFWYHTIEEDFENNPYQSYDEINVSGFWVHPQDFTEHPFDVKDTLHFFNIHEGEYCPYFETEYANEDNSGVWAHIADTIPIGSHISIKVEVDYGSLSEEYCTINDFSYHFLQSSSVTANTDTLPVLNNHATKLYPLANDEGHYLTIALVQYANLDTIYQLNDSTLQVVPLMGVDIEEAEIRYLTVNKANLEYSSARIVLKVVEESDIEAVNDSISYQTAQENFNRNILYNDIGENLTLIEVEEPLIGELSFSAYGRIYYQANENAVDTVLQLQYVAEDAFGQRDTGLVVLEVKVSTLEVEVYLNCCAVWTGLESLRAEVEISNGVPPYHITGNLFGVEVDTVISNTDGTDSVFFTEMLYWGGGYYWIDVEDAASNCSYDGSEIGCTKLGYDFEFVVETTCIDENKMEVNFEGEYECFVPFEVELNDYELEAYWVDLNNYGAESEEQDLENGQEISSRTYVSLETWDSYLTHDEVPVYWGLYGDYRGYVGCSDTLIARDDTLQMAMNGTLHFSVLANDDFGVGVWASEVEGVANGVVSRGIFSGLGMAKYLPEMGFSGMDFLQYQLIDSEGNRDTAMAFIDVVIPDTFTVNWRTQCLYPENEYLLQVSVVSGQSPYRYTDSWGRDTLVYAEEGAQGVNLEWEIRDGCGFHFFLQDAVGNLHEENQRNERFCGSSCSGGSQMSCNHTNNFADFEVSAECVSSDEVQANYELVYNCFFPYDVEANEEELYASWVDLNNIHPEDGWSSSSFENGDTLPHRSSLYLFSYETDLIYNGTVIATDDYEYWKGYLGCSDTLVAVNDTLKIGIDFTKDYYFSALANDEFSFLPLSSVEVVSGPNRGSVHELGRGYYRPDFGFVGKDHIRYKIKENGKESRAWIVIEVEVPEDFTVKWARNCQYNLDYYSPQIVIAGGMPPYRYRDNWGVDTLLYVEEGGEIVTFERQIEDGCHFRFTVSDSEGGFFMSEKYTYTCGEDCDSEELLFKPLSVTAVNDCSPSNGSSPQVQIQIHNGLPPYHYTDTWGNDTIVETNGTDSPLLQFEILPAPPPYFVYTVSDNFADTMQQSLGCVYRCLNQDGLPYNIMEDVECINDSVQWNFEGATRILDSGGRISGTWKNTSNLENWQDSNDLQVGQRIPNRSYVQLFAYTSQSCNSSLLDTYVGYVGCSIELKAINDTLYTLQNEPITSNVIFEDEFDFVTEVKRLSSPSNGICSQWSNAGYFTYKPHNGFVGIDSFQYEIKNLEGEWSAATVHIFVETVVGIEENTSMSEIQLYPNPFNDQLYLQTSILFANSSPLQITLFNTVGQKVYEKNVESSFEVLELKDLESGVYFVEIEGQLGKWRKKVLKL